MEQTVKVKLSKEHELEVLKTQFQNSLNLEYRLELLNKRMKEWYTLEWMDFRKEILKSGEKLPYRKQNDLQKYFINQKKKVLSLSKELCVVKFDMIKTS
ncbi:MAG TPA: hypothetical protein VNW99_00265 [Cytophagaceae bacterium]|jgi:hypothetical protein|nr:hypothetical protein [Cytophagaceae bacterium]